MINLLEIQNFKCFTEKTRIDFSPLTVNLGMNSVGKSTVVQALLLIRQTYEKMQHKNAHEHDIISLNDSYGLEIGKSTGIMSAHEENKILFQINNKIKFEYSEFEDPLFLKASCNNCVDKLQSSLGLFSDQIYYLNAERLGPRDYEIIDSLSKKNCGMHGEKTFQTINSLIRERFIVMDLRKAPGEENESSDIDKQIEGWMKQIIPGIELRIKPQEGLRLLQLQVQQSALDTGFGTPYNFGFGISYVLPIIVTLLMAEKNSIVIVENPEAHLHPMGQSQMGKMLAQMALSGLQIIVETHSEHIINGIRIALLKQKASNDILSLNYFYSTPNEKGRNTNSVKKIELNKNMDILDWPQGFWDQEEEDLRTLRELRKQNDS